MRRNDRRQARGRHLSSGSVIPPTRLRLLAACTVTALTPLALALGCGPAGEAAVDARPSEAGAERADVGASDAANDDDSGAYIEPGPTPQECRAARLDAGTLSDGADAGEELAFADEFDGDAVDESKWTIREGYRGKENSVNTATRDAVRVRDGLLSITTRPDPTNPEHPYASGHIDTVGRFAFTYGRVAFRARFPKAMGVWYAIWAVPWAGAGTPFPELDVEVLGKNPKEIWFVNHWDAPPLPADQRRRFVTVKDVDGSVFQDYEVRWTPDAVTWSIGGTPYLTSSDRGLPRAPMVWLINGWVGGWGGMPDGTTPFPVTFDVDYLRIYRQGDARGAPQVRVANARAAYSQRAELIRVDVADLDLPCLVVTMTTETGRLAGRIAKPPYFFPLGGVPKGRHVLTFEADDGLRKVSTTLEADVR